MYLYKLRITGRCYSPLVWTLVRSWVFAKWCGCSGGVQSSHEFLLSATFLRQRYTDSDFNYIFKPMRWNFILGFETLEWLRQEFQTWWKIVRQLWLLISAWRKTPSILGTVLRLHLSGMAYFQYTCSFSGFCYLNVVSRKWSGSYRMLGW